MRGRRRGVKYVAPESLAVHQQVLPSHLVQVHGLDRAARWRVSWVKELVTGVHAAELDVCREKGVAEEAAQSRGPVDVDSGLETWISALEAFELLGRVRNAWKALKHHSWQTEDVVSWKRTRRAK